MAGDEDDFIAGLTDSEEENTSNADMSDDDENFTVTLRNIDKDEEDDIDDDTDGDGPGADLTKPTRSGGIPGEQSIEDFYNSRSRLALFIQWSEHDLDEFLFEHKYVESVWQEYNVQYIEKARKAATDAGKPFRLGYVSLDELVAMLNYDEIDRFLVPMQEDQAQWGIKEWLCRVLEMFRLFCLRADMFKNRKITPANEWIWAYMVMKCKEIHEMDPLKKQQAIAEHNTRKMVARDGN